MADDTHYPALRQLEQSFNSHMREFRDGIEDSEAFLYWLEETAILTLGHVDDGELAAMFTDPAAANAILIGQPASKPRRTPDEHPLETRLDERLREKIESFVFSPAFRRAYNNLKTNATEYTDDRPRGVDSGGAPALRPAIDELARRQQGVLDDLLQDSGFRDSTEQLEWSRDVVAATRGHIPGDELRLMTLLERDPALNSALLGDGEMDEGDRQNFLQVFAANALLPLFNSAVRDLAQTAGEIASENVSSVGEVVDV